METLPFNFLNTQYGVQKLDPSDIIINITTYLVMFKKELNYVLAATVMDVQYVEHKQNSFIQS